MTADKDGTNVPEEGEGLSLRDAIQRFSDPAKWQRHVAAAAAAAGKTRAGFFFFGGKPIAGWDAYDQAEADNRLIDAAEDAWAALYPEFLRRLRCGELIASGRQVPVDPAVGRQVIPTDLWTVLRPNFENSSARGGGCQFVSIIVYEQHVARGRAQITSAVSPEDQHVASFPGRPSIMRAIIAHMKERAERGERASTLSAEARKLEHWARTAFPGQQIPKVNSIRNGIREEYRKLVAGKSA